MNGVSALTSPCVEGGGFNEASALEEGGEEKARLEDEGSSQILQHNQSLRSYKSAVPNMGISITRAYEVGMILHCCVWKYVHCLFIVLLSPPVYVFIFHTCLS